MKNEEKIFLVFILIVSLLMTFLSFRFSAASRLLPLMSGILTSVLVLFLLLLFLSPKALRWYTRLENKSLTKIESLSKKEKRNEITITLWFIGGVLVIYFLGFIATIPIFLFFFLRLYAKESWMVSVLVPCISTVVIYFVFITILQVPLYQGLLFG